MSKQSVRNKNDVEVISKMSALQQGILFHSLQLEGADPYFYQFGFEIKGHFDEKLFYHAWEQVARHYQVLRSNYRWEEIDAPLQIVFKTPRLAVDVIDIASLPTEEVDAFIEKHLAEIKERGYDFRQGLPVTVSVFVQGDKHWRFYWSLHHISLDGWSVSKVLGDLLGSYQALLRNEIYSLPSTLPFTSYIQWVHGQNTSMLEQYWSEVLAGVDEKTPLPLRGDYDDARYAERMLVFSRSTSDQMRAAARDMGITVNTLVQGAWGLLLAAYSDRDEVLFGVTTSGRSASLPGLHTVVGLCINTLPFRTLIDPQLSVAEWLRRVQEKSVASREFEYSSLSELSKYADLPEGENLFDSILVFENYPIDEALKKAPADMRISSIDAEQSREGDILYCNGRNNYPLSVIAALNDRLELILAYHCKQYSHEDIEELSRQLEHQLLSLVGSGSQPLGNVLALLPTAQPCQEETQTQVAIQQELFSENDFLALWQQSVIKHPQQIAVAAVTQQLSYAELERASNQLAHHLQAQGIGTGAVVALCQERSPDWVVSLLAVLKLGAIYLPLDNQQPVERLQQLLHNSNAALLIHPAVDTALATATQCPSLTYQPEQWADQSDAALATVIEPQQPAYIIYTSGSTGQPKGVVVSHSALANYLQAVLQRLELPENASLALVSSIAADLGHTMLFGALASGRSLHLLSHDHAFDPDRFAQYMAEQHIDVLKIAPSHLQALLQAGKAADVLPAKMLILGGEACPWGLVEKVRALKPECRIINHYGPTETTVGVLTHEVSERLQDSHSVPVGLALANVRAELLDAYLNPVPQRVAGELYLGGATLAQGYLGQAAATAERFIPAEGGGRLYRTGDRARLSKDQLLEFIGRTDDQVKIRGYRVEPGEVGRVLAALPSVQDAVVLALPLDSDETRLQLVGYAVADKNTSSEALQQLMKERLPDYLVPAQVMLLEQLPLTANGKLDKRALPKPGAIKQAYVAPGNEIERILASVWADVLKLEQVGTTDNFFELGGDSILSLQIIARAKRQGIKLTPKQVFEQQTIGQLAKVAQVIEAKPQAAMPVSEAKKRSPLIVLSPVQLANLPIPAEEIEDIYPLSPMQQGMLFHTLLDTEAGHYINQMRVDVQGLDVERFKAAWHAAISRHEVLRANFVTVETPLQVIRKRIDAPCTLLDWRTEAQLSQKLDALALEDRSKGFDLASDPMLRLTLIRTTDNTHHLIHTTHHILLDGWSNSQLMGEILQNYAGVAPTPVTSQYRDYIEWLGEQDTSAGEAFWKEQLVELDGPTRLAKSIRQPDLQSESGYGYQQVVFDKQQTEALNNFAQSQRVTLNTLVQAAWLILLQHYTGQDSVVCGVTVSGRPADLDGIEQQLGLFINTLPLAARPLPEQSVGQWLQALQAQNLALREHEYTPLYEVQRWAGSSGEALFDTLLVFENYPISQALEQGASYGLTFSGLSGEGQTNYELTIAAEVSETLSVNFIYSRTAFHDRTIESVTAGFERLLLAMSNDADVSLGELTLLGSEELRQVIGEWNRTEASYPVERCLHQLIEQQVVKTPEATALVFGDQSLSYSELNQRANQLAYKLRELGVGPDVLVGIAVERSLEMVIGLLAI
ncbi:non-ribosomal peptide synthetase, partial [Pseudomonas sp. FME51]|uniref:non-ribosomal peptide synthetase n=1 Tax=Pseudomonas sp. FME51 TaxID=2742609 RepID=UPI00186785E3